MMELYPGWVNLIVYVTILGAIGLGGWYILSLYFIHSRKKEEDLPHMSAPEGIDEVVSGIPLALFVFYIFFAVSTIVYVLYIWLWGITY